MDDFAVQIEALAAIIKADATKLRPFRKFLTAELVSGDPATTTTIQISPSYVAVILNIEVDSYPKIAASFDYTRRQAYSYADQLFFQWTKDGKVLTPQLDYHLWLGESFFVVDTGKLVLSVQLQNWGPAIDSQLTNIRIAGVLVPRTYGHALMPISEARF